MRGRLTAQGIGIEPGPDFVPPRMALDGPPEQPLGPVHIDRDEWLRRTRESIEAAGGTVLGVFG